MDLVDQAEDLEAVLEEELVLLLQEDHLKVVRSHQVILAEEEEVEATKVAMENFYT